MRNRWVSIAIHLVSAFCGVRASFALLSAIAVIAALAMPFRLAAQQAANPVPLVNQPLVPDAKAPGGAGFEIAVNGTGFVSGAKVNWNGSPLATTFVNGSRLTAGVPASHIATAGTASVTVVNPSPGGGASNVAFFEVTPASPTIALSRSSYPTHQNADSVAVADFNGDGKLDLAVANLFGNEVSVYLGNGDGTFQTAVNYPAGGANLYSVAVADVNGDGKPDLILANNYLYDAPGTVAILLGNGDGTFQAAVNYSVGSEPASVAVGDFNGDGKLDLAVANFNDNSVSILLGNGDGTFQAAVNYGIGSQGQPISVAVGDFNQDGKLDLAVANNDEGVSILLGNGDGTFQPAVNYGAGVDPVAVAAADFNGDGKLDLAVANQGGGVSVLLGNGDGSFQSAVNYSAGVEPVSIAVADFNGDSKLDLAVADQNSGAVSVLLGKGNGTFRSPLMHGVGTTAFSVALGDFNDEGRIDLAVGGSISVSILLQTSLSVSPASLSFGNQTGGTSAAQVVTLTDIADIGAQPVSIESIAVNGTDAGDFAQTTTCGSSLAVGASCTISITFTPTQLGSRTASVTITDSAVGSPQSVALSGAGVSPVSLSSGSLSFANQVTGTSSATQAVTLTNIGAQPLSSVSIAVTVANAADFSQTNTCGTSVPAGGSCYISVTFTPAALGPLTASVTITDGAPGSPQSVALSGTGLSPVSLSSGSLSFANQVTGTSSAAQAVTLTNIGAQPLSSISIAVTGANAADFSQTNTCGTSVPAGASCNISVTFTPAALGPLSASITINDSAPGSPQSVALSGTGVSPVSLSSGSLSFANQVTGTSSAAQAVTLTNIGAQPLSSVSIAVTGANVADFSQTNTCGTSVPAGGSCYISVTFTPAALGPLTASVTITDSAPGSPQSVALSGIGVNAGPNVTLSPTSLSFSCGTHPRVGCYCSRPQTVTLANYGTMTVNISSIAVSSSNFTSTSQCGSSVMPGSSCTITVGANSGNPIGNYSGALDVTDSAPGSPQAASLSDDVACTP